MNKKSAALIALTLAFGGVAASTPVAQAATVTTWTKKVVSGISSLNVLSGPGTSYAAVGSLRPGSTVTGTVSGSWLKITSGSFAGRYVATSFLTAGTSKTIGDTPVTPTPASVVTRTVLSPKGTLDVRSGPSVNSALVATLKNETTVTGTVSGTWLKMTTGAYAGKYVSTTHLVTRFNDTAQPSSGQQVGYVLADPGVDGSYMNIRSSASTTASIVGTYGAHARVVGTPVGDGTWWKVSKGYVHSAGLTAKANPSSFNAKIPTSELCLIPVAYYSHNGTKIGYGYNEKTPRYIQCKALPNLIAMENAYKVAWGTFAEIDNGYRGWAEQKYWYDLYAPRGITVAKPGESNHGYGLAIDFRAPYGDGFTVFKQGGDGYNWLLANSGKFGFNNPYVNLAKQDDVHWNFVG